MATEPKIFYTTFSVDGDAQTITLTGGGEIRASSKHYFKARFAFVDGDSNAFLRLDHLTATFSPVPAERSRNGAYSVPLEETEGVYECEIPWEVLTRRGNVYVGVFAGDMLVTNEAIIRVTKAAPVLGSHSQPTESWWSRFSAALAAAVASLTARINTKQDALIAGENITIDDNVISAQGGASVTPYDEHPQMDGAASAGSSTKYARGDHRHPTDTALAGRIATIEGKEGGWNAKWGSGTIGEIPITALDATTQINIMRGSNAVSYTAQTLTDAQKAQARTNIGAVSRSDIGTVFTIKGEVATYEDLPASGNAVGDVYYVSYEFAGYIWLETTDDPSGYWEELGAPIDLSAYRTAVNQDIIDASLAAAIPSASSATPQALGTAAAGSSSDYSRADHVHDFNADFKTALLQLAAKVAYIDSDGQTYYDALEAALTHRTLSSITAVFTQGTNVIYDTDSLETLRQYLTVTAHYSDSTTATVTGYTLSGTLTEGTSTITVSYGGKTTTFNVTVSGPQVLSGYTEVGTPAISNGILSVTEGNFIKTPQPFDPEDSTWKVTCKYKITGSLGSYADVFGSVSDTNASKSGLLLELNNTDKRHGATFLSSNGTSWDIAGTLNNFVLSDAAASNWVWFTIEYDGSAYVSSYSLDGESYTQLTSVSSSSKVKGGFAVAYGLKRNGVFNGDIDLNECKIYIDGVLWWKAIA